MKPTAPGRDPLLLRAAPVLPLLAVILAFVYEPLLRAFFDPQDFLTILVPRAAGWSLGRYLAEGWVYVLPDGTVGGFFRPLASLMYMPEYSLFGSSPAGYGAVSVVTHACCCLAVGWLAVRMGLSRSAAFVAVLLLAAHPRATMAVRMANTRPDVLATMFTILAAGMVIGSGTARAWRSALAPAGLCLLAVLSKELGLASLVLTPLFLLAGPGGTVGRGQALRLFTALTAVLVLVAVSRFLVLDIVTGYSGYSTPGRALLDAVRLFRNVSGTAWMPGTAAGMAATVAVAASLAIPVAARRGGLIRLGMVTAAGLLLGSQSIINFGPGHYEYGACAALALLAACAADSLFAGRAPKPLAVAAACAALLAPAAMIGRRMNEEYATFTLEQKALYEAVERASGEIDPGTRWIVVLGRGHVEKMIPWYVHFLQRSEQAQFDFSAPGGPIPGGSGVLRYDGREVGVEPPSADGPR